MEIIIKGIMDEKGNKTTEVYQDVTDCYIAIRQAVPYEKEKKVGFELRVKSRSLGANLRDIAKELYQSWIEIQEILKKNNGSS